MSEQQEAAQSSGLDKAKLVIAIVLIVGGIFAYYWFENQSAWLRAAYVLDRHWGGVGAGLADPDRPRHAELRPQFAQRSAQDGLADPSGDHADHPVRDVTVLVVGVFMWVLDLVLFWALSGLTGQGA